MGRVKKESITQMTFGRYKDETGNRYGRLVVKYLSGNRRQKALCWIAECDCGEVVDVCGVNLRRGHTKSCGCWRVDNAKEMFTIHGESTEMSITYKVWRDIKSRCSTTNSRTFQHKLYADKGIKVCGRWQDSYLNFVEDMGIRPEGYYITRIDKNGNYEPGNCKWVKGKEICRGKDEK